MLMTRSGIGYDSHRFLDGRRLVLGGVNIPFHRGLSGHSDADVLIHALCDALLGAVADGDIGQHFPDNDPLWKNADSTVLLKNVVECLCRKGWGVVNTDVTVIAEAPKLMPYIPAMRARLAEVMGIDIACVSVKAKTNEGMDAAGRCEGIMAMSVATVFFKGSVIGDKPTTRGCAPGENEGDNLNIERRTSKL
ncbi:MAG: 2-C-methyl-D-erythritol 2,4-cyclodiphosphate synthase [Kiritimatiellae bacterium]|nr:2-C-methyl-D-erythritol 2,4-cyclodiphosphate synthase [Kiritimatiellia bacterium]